MFILPHLKALTAGNFASTVFKNSALDLNFASTKSLIDSATGQNLVTFTRASSATYIDSAGTLQTAVTNLLLQSEDFTTTWFLTSATLSSNAIAAPNGSLTAEQLIEAATTANHEAGQTFASPVANATYTLSCYLKAATSTTAGIRFSNGLNGTGIICSVDLTAQTATVIAGAGTATIANVGSGWFRVSLTATASGAPSSTTVSIFRSIGTAGSIANSIYIWGAQLEQSSTVGEYIPTTGTINSAPRFDHNPTTGESLGLLVEDQRTNSIRNNTMVGAVAGTPGTSPTNWTLGGLSGLTQTIVGTGTESGIAYIDIRIFGTTSSALFFGVRPENITVVAATPNSIWTSTFYVRLVGGSLTNVTGVKNVLTNFNSSGVALNQFAVASLTPTSAALATQRYSLSTTSATFADATTAFVVNGLQVEANSGAAIDITLRIGLPQLELGAFATSVIPTSTAAATRNADVANITGSNFGTTRTNLLLRSEAIATSPWFAGANTTLTNNTSEVLDPAGGSTATKVLVSGGTGAFGQGATLTAAIHTGSIWLRCSTGTISASLIVYLSGSPFTNIGTANVTITTFWQRFTVVTSTATAAAYNLQLNNIAVGTVYAWGAQLEVGSAVTPYIPTTTAAVSVFESSWYRQNEGTVFYDGTVSQGLAGFPWFYNISDGTVNNSIGVYQFTNGIYGGTQAGGVAATPDPSVLFSPVPGSTAKHALAVKALDTRAALNSTLSSAQLSTVMPVVNTLSIGQRVTGNRMTGTIKRLTYWPQRLPNSTLQAITQ